MPDHDMDRQTIALLRRAIALAQLIAPYSPTVRDALAELHIARGCADLVCAAEAALDLLTELYPTLRPTETTREAAIWVVCERLRTALAQVQPGAAAPGDLRGATIAPAHDADFTP